MADYATIMRALRNAHAAGDTQAATRLAAMAKEAMPPDQGPPAPQTIDQMIADIQIPERGRVKGFAEEMGRSFLSGASRGAAELAGLPGTLSDLADAGARAAGVLTGPDRAAPVSGATIRSGLAAATGGESEYKSETIPGRFAGSVGEFVGGGAGAKAGVIGGLAAEAAGMATEGTVLEPYARAAAGIAAPMAAQRIPGLRPMGGDPVRTAQAETLRAQGVTPTAGQTLRSQTLQSAEDALEPSIAQLEDFTQAAMRSIGSNARRATPEALDDAVKAIGQTMDDALSGVSFQPTVQMAQSVDDVLGYYNPMAIPRKAQDIAEEIASAATSPNARPIDLTKLREWRTALGSMVNSADEATRDVARTLREVIDDATETALIAAGRADDLARLRDARVKYRNYLAVSDASTRAGAEAGIVSPTQLNQAVIRTTGRGQYARGAGTELSELSRAGASVLRPAPTVSAAGRRSIPQIDQYATPIGGALAGFAATGGSPVGAAVGGTLGLGAIPAYRRAITSRPMQNVFLNPGFVAGETARSVPGVVAGSRDPRYTPRNALR